MNDRIPHEIERCEQVALATAIGAVESRDRQHRRLVTRDLARPRIARVAHPTGAQSERLLAADGAMVLDAEFDEHGRCKPLNLGDEAHFAQICCGKSHQTTMTQYIRAFNATPPEMPGTCSSIL
jgi:hypothetical protein